MEAIHELAPDRGVFRAIHEVQARLKGKTEVGEFVEQYVVANLLEGISVNIMTR
jgi:hypothetical protein